MVGQFAFRAVSALMPVLYVIGGLWTFAADYSWLSDKIGSLFAFLAMFFLPISLPLVPVLAGFMDGQWALLQLAIGVVVAVLVVNAVTAALATQAQL